MQSNAVLCISYISIKLGEEDKVFIELLFYNSKNLKLKKKIDY